MKFRVFAVTSLIMVSALFPITSFSMIHKLCDFDECCYVDGGGNGYCVPNGLGV